MTKIITKWEQRAKAHRFRDKTKPNAPKRSAPTVGQTPVGKKIKLPKRDRHGRIAYIAYGSNLHKKSMWQRCPGAIYDGRIMLENARLVFRGAADLQLEPSYRCPAGVWSITADDERRLDSYEGVEGGSYSKYYITIGKKKKRTALIYLMNDRRGIWPPSAWYAEIVRRGYHDFKLEESYLNEAVKHSFVSKEPSEQTTKRRCNQKKGDVQRTLVAIPESVAMARIDRIRELEERGVMPPLDREGLAYQQAQETFEKTGDEELARQVFNDCMMPQWRTLQ